MSTLTESQTLSVDAAMAANRQRSTVLTGQLDNNQGSPTFTGRMTLEQLADLTVVQNRKWADTAGASMDQVTQREIIDGHANGLAVFILQGLVDATIKRAAGDVNVAPLVDHLHRIQDTIGRSMHYGLPPVTLVLPRQPEIKQMIDSNGQVVSARMIVPAGVFFYVADGQHRREAARRVRVFLNELISNRRAPKSKLYPASEAPIAVEEIEAWGAVQETFRGWTVVSFEAHIGLTVDQARQMFTNYNCNVKPVKADLNLEFDKSNPINVFGKDDVLDGILKTSKGEPVELDVRHVASINGFLFLGSASIKSAPFNITQEKPVALDFWTCIVKSPDWTRPGSMLREVAVLKGLAKAWFYVFIAKRNRREGKAAAVRAYIRSTTFDEKWLDTVPGLKDHTVPAEGGSIRFSPAHNDIVSKIVAHVLPKDS